MGFYSNVINTVIQWISSAIVLMSIYGPRSGMMRRAIVQAAPVLSAQQSKCIFRKGKREFP
jgi:hypothetical protein